MAYNQETTAEIKVYLHHHVVAKLNEDAYQKGVSRSRLIGSIIEDYILDEETHEAEEVKKNEEK